MRARVALLLLLLACIGCVPMSPDGGRGIPVREIRTDTVWSGRIVVDGAVKVFKGSTLTILPGSEITFVPRDLDRDGLGDGTLIVEGSLIAVGSHARPISFRSAAAAPRPGDWLELRLDFSRDAHLQYCEIRDSAHALHAHFTHVVLEDSHIHRNLDGSRLGQGDFVLQRNLIEDNQGRGINFRNSNVTIAANIIRNNGTGVFLFETDRPLTMNGNNLYGNGDNLRLGDFFHNDISIGDNWWGSADPAEVGASIYDRRVDATLGRVTVGIAPAWFEAAGPNDPTRLQVEAGLPTEGFVDAPPVAVGEQLLVASWDGHLRLTDGAGRLLWNAPVGDVVDSAPVYDGSRVYGQSWRREAFALSAVDGRRLWSFSYPDSGNDDHRQGGVARVSDLLLVPAWNGTLYALDAERGTLRWSHATPGPLRATPASDGERIYLPGGDGVLRAFDLSGTLLWQGSAGAAQLAPLALATTGPVSLDRDGTLTALDRNGQVLWQRPLSEPCFYAGPCLAGDELFVATAAGNLWKIDARSGRIVWRKSGLGPVYATPLWLAGRLVVADNDGGVTLIDGASGRFLDRKELGAPIQGSPTQVGARIAVGCRDRRVYLLALQLPPDAGGQP